MRQIFSMFKSITFEKDHKNISKIKSNIDYNIMPVSVDKRKRQNKTNKKLAPLFSPKVLIYEKPINESLPTMKSEMAKMSLTTSDAFLLFPLPKSTRK